MYDSYQDVFDRKNEHPNNWFNKSNDLRASAGAIWYAIQEGNSSHIAEDLSLGKGFDMAIACWHVYQMNFGMSFELMFKAIARASLSNFPMSHDLVELAKEVDVIIGDKENKVLSVLTEAIIWHGRYPVPRDPKPPKKSGKETFEAHYKNYTEVLFDEVPMGSIKLKKHNDVLDWENLDEIWCRLSGIFFERYKNGYEKRRPRYF
jgi:hypothetical protein